MKYQRPTAHNQKRQILKNTRAVTRLAKVVKDTQIYTDWQYTKEYTIAPGSWLCDGLMNCPDWTQWGRTSEPSKDSASAWLQRYMCYFGVYTTGPSVTRVHIFLVTPTREQASRDPRPVAAGGGGSPVVYKEFVSSNDGAMCMYLNQDVFRIHAHRVMQLTVEQPGAAPPANPPDAPGNPYTTYKHLYIRSKSGVRIRYPVGVLNQGTYDGVPWAKTPQEYHPYSQKMFLMMYCETGNAGGVKVAMHNNITIRTSD